MAMSEATAILLDLDAQSGALARRWRRWEEECLRALAPARTISVHGAAEAEAAAREAALEGTTKLVAMGGGAVAHGVLNALMSLAESHRAGIKFGVLALDGADAWARTLGWPLGFLRQLDALRAGHTLPYDIGQVECLDDLGRSIRRYFLNGASFGIAGQIRAAWRRSGGEGAAARPDAPQALQSIARTLRLLTGRDDAWVRLESGASGSARGGAEIYRGPWVAGMLMVGRYYPRLGEVAPEADPCDGLLNLVGLTGRPGWRALGWLTGLWPRAGGAGLTVAQGPEFSAAGVGEPIHLELDGVLAGLLPATFLLLPRALNAIVPTVPARLMKPEFKPIRAVAQRPLVAGRVRAKWPIGA